MCLEWRAAGSGRRVGCSDFTFWVRRAQGGTGPWVATFHVLSGSPRRPAPGPHLDADQVLEVDVLSVLAVAVGGGAT